MSIIIKRLGKSTENDCVKYNMKFVSFGSDMSTKLIELTKWTRQYAATDSNVMRTYQDWKIEQLNCLQ